MNPLLLGVLLLIGGLAIIWLSSTAKYPLLVTVFFWIGLVLAVFGAILVIAQPLIWAYAQIRSMLGV